MKTLKEWVRICSDPSWRIQIAITYDTEGCRNFGKVPVLAPGYDEWSLTADSVQEVGMVRPFACPEPAPENWRFFLASHNGIKWRHHLPSVSDDERAQLSEDERRRRFLEAEKSKEYASFFLRNRMRTSLAEGDIEDALSWAFEAGVGFGRLWLRQEYADSLKTSAPKVPLSQINEIAYYALQRHGVELNAVTLLQKMGAKMRLSRGVPTWFFDSGKNLDQKDFQRAVNAAKTALGRDS